MNILPCCITLLGLATIAPAALADTVNRCVAADGHVTWSNLDCPKGQVTQKVDLNPAVVDSRGLREWAKRSPPQRESAVRNRGGYAQVVRVRDSIACENARRDYRFEAGNPQARRSMLSALREEMRQACGGS